MNIDVGEMQTSVRNKKKGTLQHELTKQRFHFCMYSPFRSKLIQKSSIFVKQHVLECQYRFMWVAEADSPTETRLTQLQVPSSDLWQGWTCIPRRHEQKCTYTIVVV